VRDSAAPTLIAVAEGTEVSHPDVVRLARTPGGLDLDGLLAELYRRQVVSLLIEGGPVVAGSFLRAGLVDRVIGYLAPALLGSGAAALGPAGVHTIADTHRLIFHEISPVGPDLRLVARPAPPKETRVHWNR
jgi:diaminohydroxyphosphoribosylaminopyrimidine deaminase / 5-amino-6-(5-phosphoribosylamino)uracil reductase